MKHLKIFIPKLTSSRDYSFKSSTILRWAKYYLLLLASLLIGAPKSFATEQEAIDNARATANWVQKHYTNVCFRDDFSHGELDKGDYYDLEVNFLTGVTYYLIAGGCNSSDDIDLYVYDGYGNLVVRDSDVSKMATVSFTPTVGGTFTVRIKMYKASAITVHWSLLYGYICNK